MRAAHVLVGFGVTFCGFDAALALDPVTHTLTVSRHEKVDLTDDRAKEILKEASAALQTDNDGNAGGGNSDDVACPVTLALSGTVTTFAAPQDLASEADWAALKKLPGSVKVVRDVSWCDGDAPKAIGCGSTPGQTFVIERYTIDGAIYEFKLWAHEFGHNTGLGHNRYNKEAIMYQGAANRREVNSSACASFHKGRTLTLDGRLMSETGGSQSDGLQPIAQFVHNVPEEGIRFEVASRYPISVAPYLIGLVKGKDPELATTAIAILGAIGASEAINSIEDFMSNQERAEAITRGNVSTLVDTLLSFGWLAHTSGSPQAVRILERSADPHTWTSMAYLAEGGPARLPQDWQLPFVRASLRGLALSGHPDAELALQRIQQRINEMPKDQKPGKLADLMQEMLPDLEATYTLTANEGLAAYYRAQRARSATSDRQAQ